MACPCLLKHIRAGKLRALAVATGLALGGIVKQDQPNQA